MQSTEDAGHNGLERVACGTSFARRMMGAIGFTLLGVAVAVPAICLYLGRRERIRGRSSKSQPSDDAAAPAEPILITLVPDSAADTPAAEPMPPYVASSERDRFHVPSCRWARRIRQEHRLVFEHREDAIAEGYVPCGTCSP